MASPLSLPADVAVSVHELSKQFRIDGYRTAPGSMKQKIEGVVRKIAGRPRIEPEVHHFWALKDVSFDVRKGEVLGIIGRNGSGKTTLLKLIGRLLHPTKGSVLMQGRVGSYLGMGVGMHEELTGKENIFVNGTMLGMSKEEIMELLPQIVAFAELESFMEMPVKYYSSGMHARLSFSVAVHMPGRDILLIDETLSTGDLAFNNKSRGMLRTVVDQGSTVLFTSHSPDEIIATSDRCVYLHKGSIRDIGDPETMIARYRNDLGV